MTPTDTGRGGIIPQEGRRRMGRIGKTAQGFNWTEGQYTRRTLTRSFDTLEAAQKFAEGKDTRDIYRAHGRFVVEWVKTTHEERKG